MTLRAFGRRRISSVTAPKSTGRWRNWRGRGEQFRVLAEEARALREKYREEFKSVRQEREALRHAAEEARKAAEEARHATIAAVAATAEALSANLAQMQFLEDARNTLQTDEAERNQMTFTGVRSFPLAPGGDDLVLRRDDFHGVQDLLRDVNELIALGIKISATTGS